MEKIESGRVCGKCGNRYMRKNCEFCKRGEQWEAVKRTPLTNSTFTPRISRILNNSNDPIEAKVIDSSLYLYGIVSAGKTIHACNLLLQHLKYHFMKVIPLTCKFMSVPYLLLEIKSTFSDVSEITETDLIKKYSNIDVLVLDDLGAEKMTEWAYSVLYVLINERYEKDKITIFTSNLSLNELSEKLGDDRIPSRIENQGKIIYYQKKYGK
jgi:DNA replication protein DnaC